MVGTGLFKIQTLLLLISSVATTHPNPPFSDYCGLPPLREPFKVEGFFTAKYFPSNNNMPIINEGVVSTPNLSLPPDYTHLDPSYVSYNPAGGLLPEKRVRRHSDTDVGCDYE